jgi:hypothetical protein
MLWLRNIDPLPQPFQGWGVRILWLLDIDPLLVYMVRGFKMLWLRNIEPPLPKHFKAGESEYYGC